MTAGDGLRTPCRRPNHRPLGRAPHGGYVLRVRMQLGLMLMLELCAEFVFGRGRAPARDTVIAAAAAAVDPSWSSTEGARPLVPRVRSPRIRAAM